MTEPTHEPTGDGNTQRIVFSIDGRTIWQVIGAILVTLFLLTTIGSADASPSKVMAAAGKSMVILMAADVALIVGVGLVFVQTGSLTISETVLPASGTAAVAAFVGQRLLFGLVVVLAVSYLSYLGLVMGGDATLGAAVTGASRETASYLARLARGELGMTIAGSSTYAAVPVADVLPDRFGKSVGSLAASLALATFVGIGLGI